MGRLRLRNRASRTATGPGVLRLLWAAPATLIGLAFGLPMLLAGAQWRWLGSHAEIGGGHLGDWLLRIQGPNGYAAITLGHLVLGVDTPALAALRAHESVHVRQYERWGALFPPAYLLASAWSALQGRRPYLDNPFEREAHVRARRHQRIAHHRTQMAAPGSSSRHSQNTLA